ncbi:hypothetical protein E9531_03990 [Lampropedia puyangensis]|uniref:Molybdenum cofactor guanylyltransferase n=1 Tax=Lampropedia puyangensis TaxID=1330072 RepID=A0A4S8FD75_9BURK|nr:NTP transferase domain-containing protein [Lampropedia puyangensis]THU04554.1 hypothetical protein E9531_03990 [Lampropedia puyangensis]
MFSVRIQTEPIDLAALDEANTPTRGSAGAQVRFVGKVRNDARSAAQSHLVLEHFPGVTEAEIERIIALARQRWDVQMVRVIHRVGPIGVGEDIVLVDTACAHRLAAYEANAFIMDYLKTEAPFWKQEHFVDGNQLWVEAKSSDQHVRQRWDQETTPATAPLRIGGLILAGGQGSRMGYVNKGLLLLHDLPLVQHVAQRLLPQVDHLAISANHDVADYVRFGYPVFSDLPNLQGQGPAAGILSATAQWPATLDAVLIAPCDTPYLPADLIPRLRQTLLSSPDTCAVMAATPSGPHPSIALCKPSALLRLWGHIQQHPNPSLRSWLEPLKVRPVVFDDEHAFTNINDHATLGAMQTPAAPQSAH